MPKAGAVLRGWWRSWYDKEEFNWPLPDGWELVEARMHGGRTLSDAELEARLRSPIGSPPLEALAAGRKSVCIAIDDLTRPTQTYRILPMVLNILNQSGIDNDNICVIVSLGTHRPLTRNDLRKKVGERVLNAVRVYNHNPYLNLTQVGVTRFGTPVMINAMFAAADLKLSIGMLAPHSYAGFSGGGKIVLPGLAGWETVLANHKPANKKLSGYVGQVRGNTRREEIDEAAGLAGLDFSINVVTNEQGETAGLFCGNVNAAFQAGAQFASEVYATELPVGADIGIFNAFPKDTELLQALNALTPWNPVAGTQDVVREGGTIVVITAASEGHGWLGLINPGGPLHQRRDLHPLYKQMLATRALFFLSPNLGQPDLLDHYPPEVKVLATWPQLLERLVARHPGPTRVAFFPSGPLQISKADLNLAQALEEAEDEPRASAGA
jgi:nickel-dependent lactate racemase